MNPTASEFLNILREIPDVIAQGLEAKFDPRIPYVPPGEDRFETTMPEPTAAQESLATEDTLEKMGQTVERIHGSLLDLFFVVTPHEHMAEWEVQGNQSIIPEAEEHDISLLPLENPSSNSEAMEEERTAAEEITESAGAEGTGQNELLERIAETLDKIESKTGHGEQPGHAGAIGEPSSGVGKHEITWSAEIDPPPYRQSSPSIGDE